jgi:hypothetical protein
VVGRRQVPFRIAGELRSLQNRDFGAVTPAERP